MFKNIVFHWTAGNYYPCDYDKIHYHFLVDKDGKVYKGKYTPENNLNCKNNNYAAHVKGGNTGRIGISICCMKDKDTPPVETQVNMMCKKAAQLCIKYGIDTENCITHAEFDPNRKIDINSLPYSGLSGVKECADYLRTLVKEYYEELKEEK